jgi:vacuolar-type H+-ATPase subunit I/STV1
MSDLLREHITHWQPELLPLLDTERAKHAKEVAGLRQVIHEAQKRDTHYTLTLLDRERKAKDEEISDLQQRIADLKAQLQDCQPVVCDEGTTEEEKP